MDQTPHHTQPPSAAPERGVIILDADAICNLCVPVAPSLRTAFGPEQYIYLLQFLSQHGFRVVIPEMVAVEATRLLKGGQNISTVFKNNPHISDKSQWFENQLAKRRPFVLDASRPADSTHKRYPNIEVIGDTGPAEVDEHCNRLRAGVDLVKDMRHAKNNRVTHTISQSVVRTLQANRSNDLGDAAILSLLNHPEKIGSPGPVFVLTNDKTLRETINTHYPAPRLVITTAAFLYGASLAGITTHAGFTAESTPQLLHDDMIRHSLREGKSLRAEQSHPWLKALEKSPFQQAMQVLGRELTAQKSSADEVPQQRHKRTELLASRYAAFGLPSMDGAPGR